MPPTVISVENLSKSYQLGVIGTGTFRGDLQRWWTRMRGQPDPTLRLDQVEQSSRHGETLWALKDVSFEIQQGEAVGIIGRNGAGKSTLLKILSEVTAPTSGQVKIRGRIASLLEVGTGFHPELTGRENIFLNGAILGMRKAEIARKFDEIVDFSGVEQFIDTPVKRYSSGMYVRLAFAVAAHLDPEILVVDEVLAVGDAEFQKKCLGKMSDVAHEGRTVLFVSHNMDAVEKLCSRALLMQKGNVVVDAANVKQVIDGYLAMGISGATAVWENSGNVLDNKWFKPIRIKLSNKDGKTLNGPVRNSELIYLSIEGEVKELARGLTIGYYCYSEKSNYPVYLSQYNDGHPDTWPVIHTGLNTLTTVIPQGILNVGQHWIKLYVSLRIGQSSKTVIVNQEDNKVVVSFSIANVSNESSGWVNRNGLIAPIQPWKNE